MMQLLRFTTAPARRLFNFAALRDPPIRDPNTPVMKPQVFSRKTITEKYELWPIMCVTAYALSQTTFFLCYATQKTDVQFFRDGIAPYEKICPNEIHKLRVTNDRKLYRRVKERDCLRRMIGCWRYWERKPRCR